MKLNIKLQQTGVLAGLSLLCSFAGYAQEKSQEEGAPLRVRQKTQLERYEPSMILSTEDRLELKKERLALIAKRRQIIDTMSISDRRRKRLLRELYFSADDALWSKTVADLEFEDVARNPDQD